MRRALILSSLCATAWCASSPVQAIGFGRTDSPSLLGQPLDFSAHVRLEADEELARECISAEVIAGENRLGADQVRVSMRPGSRGGEQAVRVVTLRAVNEPVVTINLILGCKSQVSRQFVTFLDPPVLYLARAEDPSFAASEGPRTEPRAETQMALVQGPQPGARSVGAAPTRARARAAERRRSAPPAVARYARAIQVANADPALPRRESRKISVARASVPARASGAARLQLDSAGMAPAVASAASAVADGVMAGAGAPGAPIVNAEAEQLKVLLAQERDRVRTLEAGLARLRSDAEARTKQAAVALPAALPKVEAAGVESPMLYPLVGFGALLVAAMGIALWRPKDKPFGTSRWWDLSQQPATDKAVAVPSSFDSIRSESEDLRAQLPPRVASALSVSSLGDSTQPAINGLEVRSVATRVDDGIDPVDATLPSAPEAPKRVAIHEPSMEALIDLEQEAEFFVVIGQDAAAVDLLSKHLNRDGAVSPLPYLKLLEIHRRRHDKVSHAAVTDAFQRRFGAPAPSWNASVGGGRTLDDYPATVTRLQMLWSSPREVMQAVDAWLFRRQPADDLFDLAAYRDLLFLYAVARDRADAGTSDDVDVVLPLEEAPIDVHLPIAPSHSQVTVLHPRVSRPAPLDFDISVAGPLDADSELRQAV